MADTKISQLPSATTPLSGAELVPLVQSGATVQTPTNEISKLTAATANTFTANQIIEVTDNVNAALRVTQLGTGLALRIEDSTNPDSSPVVVDASGNVGIGNTNPAAPLDIKAGTPALRLTGSDGTLYLNQFATAAGVGLNAFGAIPLGLQTNSIERLRVDANGNILNVSSGGLGYGTGSGGTVTQLTSKATLVTLNKTNGSITMNAASLAAGASVNFGMNNSTIASTDVLYAVHNSTGGGTPTGYSVQVLNIANGGANFRVTNVTGGALAEAVVINFVVIKAATS